MSQPKRYFFIADLLPGQTRYPHHHFVLYDDYAALAAENERLKASVRHYVEQDALRKAGEAIHQQRIESGSYNREKNETIKRLAAEVEHLKTRPTLANQYAEYATLAAENERLRKAGDAFFDSVIGYYGEHILEDEKHSSGQKCRDWLAAKEGRDAK